MFEDNSSKRIRGHILEFHKRRIGLFIQMDDA